jgi:hypothetical protein
MLDQISELDPAGKLIVGLFLASIFGLLIWMGVRATNASKEYLCKSCGAVGKATTVTPGSFLIETVLWVAFIVPGILYSLYRITKRHNACPVCKSREIIPVDSPIAKRVLSENR